MTPLPHRAEDIDLLRWVQVHPNEPFDPTMVVSLSTGHSSDWEWQAAVAQMEGLRGRDYIVKLRQDPTEATYWRITPKGENHLRELELFKSQTATVHDEPNPSLVVAEQWDVFISHASEDKDEIARPLADALRAKGLHVWYDEFSLVVGDSLRKKIDQGLANSRFGVVILSPHFFAKHWPEQELNGLATREVGGKKVILPLWHHVHFDDVRRYSPTLADRIAIQTDKGIPLIVEKLMSAMGRPISDYAIAQDGTMVTILTERASRRNSSSLPRGHRLVFRTKQDTLQFVESSEAQGFTFDGKHLLGI